MTERFCPGGKTRYPTGAAAQAAAAALKRKWNRRDRRQVNAYRCRRCGGWHVGHDGRTRHRHLREEAFAPAVPPRSEWSSYLPMSIDKLDADPPAIARPQPSRSPISMEPKYRRVAWTAAERDRVLERAAELAAIGRHATLGGLVREAQLALEEGLRRNLISVQSRDFAWLTEGLAARGLWPPVAAAAPAAAAPDVAASIRAIADAVAGGQARTHELLREARAERDGLRAELRATRGALELLEFAYHGLAQDFADLAAAVRAGAIVPPPPAAAPPPPPEEEQAAPGPEVAPDVGPEPEVDVVAIAPLRLHVNRDAAAPPPPRPAKPKIALVGFLPSPFNEILRKVGTERATLIQVDNRKTRNGLPQCDYVVLSSHNRRRWFDLANRVVGRANVVRIETAGVNTISEAILDLIGDHHEECRAARAVAR